MYFALMIHVNDWVNVQKGQNTAVLRNNYLIIYVILNVMDRYGNIVGSSFCIVILNLKKLKFEAVLAFLQM